MRIPKRSTKPAHRTRLGLKLRCEPLEDRRLLAVFTVSNLDDAGVGSLRQAVLEANQTSGSDQIEFSDGLTGTIALTSGQIHISDDVSIYGPGPTALTIDADSASRIFRIEGLETRVAATLDGLTLTRGVANGSNGFRGGGVLGNEADIILSDVVVEQSRGAIRTFASNVTLTHSIVRDNSSAGLLILAAGACCGHPIYRLEVDNTIVSGNSSQAFRVEGLDVAVRDSLIENNSGIDGGGIYVAGYGNSVLIDGSTIANNSVTGEGGGVMVDSADLELRNSTVSGNEAYTGAGICAISSSDTRIVNSTISNNIGTVMGAAFANDYGNLEILGSTVVNNITGDGSRPAFYAESATIDSSVLSGNGDVDFSGGASLTISESILGGVGSTNISGFDFWIGVDPLLGPLADNGGATLTHAILPGSPLIDGGPTRFSSRFDPYPVADQRGAGFIRLYGEAMDIGAVEFQPDSLDIDINDDGLVDVADLDALTAAVLAFDDSVDVDGDDQNHITDRDAWLVEAGALLHPHNEPFVLGDANLDGFLDGDDFLAWNNHKFTNNTAWSAGDFDTNGVVDGYDFLIWNGNKTLSIASRSGFSQDTRNEEDRDELKSPTRMIDLVFAAPASAPGSAANPLVPFGQPGQF